MKPGLPSAALGGWVLFLVTSSVVRAAVTVETVLPFATHRPVRVQAAEKADRAGPVECRGKIVPAAGGPPLWRGSLGKADVRAGTAAVEQTVKDLEPQLWSPGSPTLYHLVVTAKQGGQAA